MANITGLKRYSCCAHKVSNSQKLVILLAAAEDTQLLVLLRTGTARKSLPSDVLKLIAMHKLNPRGVELVKWHDERFTG
jgi:hypothetical protein